MSLFNFSITRLPLEARVIKCKSFLVAKRGLLAPCVPSVDRGNYGGEHDIFLYRVLALRERRIKQIAVFCEESFSKNHAG